MTGDQIVVKEWNTKRDLEFVFGDPCDIQSKVKSIWPETHRVIIDESIILMYQVDDGSGCHYIGSQNGSLVRLRPNQVQEITTAPV